MRLCNMFAAFLENAAKQIRNDDCSMTDEEMEQMFYECQRLMKGTISKQEACDIMHISRATFDRLVKANKLPKGISRRGSHELYWYKEDISAYLHEHNE